MIEISYNTIMESRDVSFKGYID